jgi:hypothetical protein
MHDAASTVAVGRYVNVRLQGKSRYRSQRSVQGVIYHVHPQSNGCKIVTAFGILRKGTGRVPAFYTQENLSVLEDDAPVSTSLMVLRQRALRGDVDESDRNQRFIGLREAAKKFDDRQIAESRAARAASWYVGD